MKNLICVLTIALIIGFQVSAQNSKITTGVLAEQQGNYEDAIEKLEEALSKPELVKKTKLIPKGHYYLYRSYYAVATDTSKAANYPDALFKAHDNLTKSLEHPESGKTWANRAILDNAHNNLWAAMYNEGVSVFNDGDYERSLKLFVAGDKLNEGHFLTNRMLASNYLLQTDTANSVKHLTNAIALYKEKYIDGEMAETMKETPDFELDHSQMSYLYQQLAVIYQAQKKTREALDLLTEGSKLLPEDESLKRQELAVYQQNPDLITESEQKFKDAIAANPDDNSMKLAYAGLLSRVGREADALPLYEAVYETDKDNLQANYGIGAYFINEAAKLSQEKGKTMDESKIKEMDEKVIQLVTRAYPHMIWLHNHQPEEKEWLLQLVTITPLLGKDDEMMMYTEKLAKLNSGG